jgi:integrase
MPRKSAVWFWAARGEYCTTIDRKRHRLGANKKAAEKRYHELMAKPERRVVSSDTVVSIIDSFLEYVQTHNAPRCYDWYHRHAQSFVETIPASLRATELRPLHVQKWIDQQTGWSNSTKHGGIRAIQRSFRWAVKQGYIDHSPIQIMDKPTPGRRETLVTPAEFKELIAGIKDEPFRDLLTAAWETGARPQEILAVEARHVDLANQRWVFSREESKGKKKQRVIYLTPKMLKITKRLMKQFPEGKLFRNMRKQPWNPMSINCRFQRLKEKLGRKLCLYALRHSYCTRALENGVDPVTLAELMGHMDATMISRVYSHLTHNRTRLLDQAKKAAG